MNEMDGESKEKTPEKIRPPRRYPTRSANSKNAKRARKSEEIPNNYEELKQQTEAGIIPDTVFYRATSNSMYIPSITADMLQDDGTNLKVNTDSEDFFKYVRVRQKTKLDHAQPERVFEIIDAVRRRPIIWDQRLGCHQNTCLVRRAWQQLDEELGPEDHYPLARRKQIWKNKKDYFAMAANTNNLNKWIFAEAMEFYRPMINFRTTVCRRPTVPNTQSCDSPNLLDKLILANKSIVCTPDDKKNVLTFLLKSLHETGMANREMMAIHGLKILDIFHENSLEYLEKYRKD